MYFASPLNCHIDVRKLSKVNAKTNSYKRRLTEAHEIIRDCFYQFGKMYVSCSFGKDSIVLAHLAIQQNPSVPIVFINSNYCFPDTYQVRDSFIDKYKINLHEIKQPYDYIELIKDYGLPELRTKTQQRKVINIIKRDLANEWAKKHGMQCCMWGLRKEESKARLYLLGKNGSLYFHKEKSIFMCSPLMNWRWEDVWTYIHSNDITYSAIYDKTQFCDPRQIRNTSWITTDGASENGRIQWLRHYYPEYYQRLLEIAPEIKNYG